ncbi:MAG: DUF1801 domain-containing protein [Kangiellaceae bacterium]|nr:DUF1801 domain-containing protein [Kangiellaceae bacterium]
MKISNSERVNQFLTDTSSTNSIHYDMLIEVRALFLKLKPNLVDDIKYGGIVFEQSGDLVGGIFTYKNHISIEFSNGVQFTDPKKILLGAGKHRRHIKLTQQQDIADQQCLYFINQIK